MFINQIIINRTHLSLQILSRPKRSVPQWQSTRKGCYPTCSVRGAAALKLENVHQTLKWQGRLKCQEIRRW